jgi:uncharacterized protein YlzI (FlbEa/FlbD family)
MMLLTRLNGQPMALNGDLIKSVESSPDTMITLITGEKIVVHESLQQVMEAARLWRVQLLRESLANSIADSIAMHLLQAAAKDTALTASGASHAAQQADAEREKNS